MSPVDPALWQKNAASNRGYNASIRPDLNIESHDRGRRDSNELRSEFVEHGQVGRIDSSVCLLKILYARSILSTLLGKGTSMNVLS